MKIAILNLAKYLATSIWQTNLVFVINYWGIWANLAPADVMPTLLIVIIIIIIIIIINYYYYYYIVINLQNVPQAILCMLKQKLSFFFISSAVFWRKLIFVHSLGSLSSRIPVDYIYIPDEVMKYVWHDIERWKLSSSLFQKQLLLTLMR